MSGRTKSFFEQELEKEDVADNWITGKQKIASNQKNSKVNQGKEEIVIPLKPTEKSKIPSLTELMDERLDGMRDFFQAGLDRITGKDKQPEQTTENTSKTSSNGKDNPDYGRLVSTINSMNRINGASKAVDATAIAGALCEKYGDLALAAANLAIMAPSNYDKLFGKDLHLSRLALQDLLTLDEKDVAKLKNYLAEEQKNESAKVKSKSQDSRSGQDEAAGSVNDGNSGSVTQAVVDNKLKEENAEVAKETQESIIQRLRSEYANDPEAYKEKVEQIRKQIEAWSKDGENKPFALLTSAPFEIAQQTVKLMQEAMREEDKSKAQELLKDPEQYEAAVKQTQSMVKKAETPEALAQAQYQLELLREVKKEQLNSLSEKSQKVVEIAQESLKNEGEIRAESKKAKKAAKDEYLAAKEKDDGSDDAAKAKYKEAKAQYKEDKAYYKDAKNQEKAAVKADKKIQKEEKKLLEQMKKDVKAAQKKQEKLEKQLRKQQQKEAETAEKQAKKDLKAQAKGDASKANGDDMYAASTNKKKNFAQKLADKVTKVADNVKDNALAQIKSKGGRE